MSHYHNRVLPFGTVTGGGRLFKDDIWLSVFHVLPPVTLSCHATSVRQKIFIFYELPHYIYNSAINEIINNVTLRIVRQLLTLDVAGVRFDRHVLKDDIGGFPSDFYIDMGMSRTKHCSQSSSVIITECRRLLYFPGNAARHFYDNNVVLWWEKRTMGLYHRQEAKEYS